MNDARTTARAARSIEPTRAARCLWTLQVRSVIPAMRDPSVPAARGITASSLADLLAEFQMPGQPLHGFSQEDAERVFVEVVEQLLLNAVRERRERRGSN